MKKIKIFAVALLSILVLGSCSDESGQYAEPLYTNSQKSNAILICLKSSLDTSIAKLCNADGFSSYKDELYGSKFPPDFVDSGLYFGHLFF